MTAKTILAFAQAHRKEPSLANYTMLSDAVKMLESDRDALLLARDHLTKEVAKSELRAQSFAAALHNHILAMQAALIEDCMNEPDAGFSWIFSTLAGLGHLPDIEGAKAMGGAQAWFDAKTAEESARLAALETAKP